MTAGVSRVVHEVSLARMGEHPSLPPVSAIIRRAPRVVGRGAGLAESWSDGVVAFFVVRKPSKRAPHLACLVKVGVRASFEDAESAAARELAR